MNQNRTVRILRQCIAASSQLAVSSAMLCIVAGLPSVAIAVDGSDATPPPLEEIVVTAERRSENLQRVPIAISALSASMIEEQGVRNVSAVAAQVPNMQLATPYGDAVPFFSLRGVTSTDVSLNQSGPIALYVDEVYKGLPALSSLQIFDVDRVEVLRGPQGTLYGKNTTGGAVNIYTKQPNVKKGWEGDISIGLGSLNRRTANGGINVPIVDDKLAARISFTRTEVDGFVKNRLAGQHDQNSIDDFAFRTSLAWVPSDVLRATLTYTQTRSTPNSYGAIAENIGTGGIGFATGYTRAGLGFFENQSDAPGDIRIKNRGVALRLTWDATPGITFTSVSSYDKGDWFVQEDVDASPFDIARAFYNANANSASQDFRLASRGDGPLKWLVGAYYYRDSVTVNTAYNYYYAFAGDNNGNGVNDCLDDFFTGCRLENEFRQKRQSHAIYGQATYQLENGVSLTAGLRYTKDKNSLDYYRAHLGYFDPTTNSEVLNAVETISAPPVSELDNSNWSGKFGVSYELVGSTLLYANLSRGYRGGSFNGSGYNAPEEVTTAKPEQIDSIEAGIKSELWDQRARLNLAAFHYKYKNQQFLDLTPTFLQFLYNAPKSTVEGLELEAVVRVTDPLTLRLAGGYLDATYDEISLSGQNLAGNRLTLSPKTTISGGLDWTIISGGGGSLDLHTDSHYTSRQFFDAFNQLAQDPYWVHDARLTYRTKARQLAVAAWGKNLSNKEYRTQRYDLSAFNFLYAQRGRPREYGLEINYTF